jgi:hypothetical protein
MEIVSVSKLVEFSERNFEGAYLFRGQPEDKPLLPKIARGQPKPDFLIEEKRLVREFQIRSAPYLDSADRDQWDWLAIAQHHGMATRLLDWTSNPLAALWFAVRDGQVGGPDGVVWIFPYSSEAIADQTVESPFGGERTKLFQPKHLTKTIVAQSGWFTVHKYLENEKFVPLDDNKLYKHEFKKCKVPNEKFVTLRRQLDKIGVNDSTMFPDLRGLCEYLNFVHLPDLVIRRSPRLQEEGAVRIV